MRSCVRVPKRDAASFALRGGLCQHVRCSSSQRMLLFKGYSLAALQTQSYMAVRLQASTWRGCRLPSGLAVSACLSLPSRPKVREPGEPEQGSSGVCWDRDGPPCSSLRMEETIALSALPTLPLNYCRTTQKRPHPQCHAASLKRTSNRENTIRQSCAKFQYCKNGQIDCSVRVYLL